MDGEAPTVLTAELVPEIAAPAGHPGAADARFPAVVAERDQVRRSISASPSTLRCGGNVRSRTFPRKLPASDSSSIAAQPLVSG